MDCVFCKIIKGELPCYKIYEDENVLAFLDIANDIDGHTLVIPKLHFENIFDVSEKVLYDVMSAVKKISMHYKNACGFDGVNIINANDVSAEQSVFHLHFHIIPRMKSDGVNVFPKLSGAKQKLEDVYFKLKMV